MKSTDRCFPCESRSTDAPRPGAESSLYAGVRRLWLRYRSCGEDGQSLVEFGMVVPLLLLVLTGIFSFGIIFNQYEVLTNATNSAARYFAASRNNSSTTSGNTMAPNGDACAYVATIVQGDVPSLTTSSLQYTINYTVTATNTSTKLANNAASPSCGSLVLTSGDIVTVTVTYPVTAQLYGWAARNLTLSASSTELVQ